MIDYFSFNWTFIIPSYVVAIVIWILSPKLSTVGLRRGVRASISFLVFPVFIPGHPPFFLLGWMLPWLFLIYGFWVPYLLITLGIWAFFIFVSQVTKPKEKKDSPVT